jgi:hypothetical protein
LAGLVKKIDQQLATVAGKTTRPLGAFVLVDGKAEDFNMKLVSMAEEKSLTQVSLCIGAPPNDYEVASDADITVVIYQPGRRGDQKVTANFALHKCDLTDEKADAIVKAFAEVLPK